MQYGSRDFLFLKDNIYFDAERECRLSKIRFKAVFSFEDSYLNLFKFFFIV